MPFITEDSIRRIIDAAEIVDVVGKFVELKKNKACCPFHNESSPSFTVTPAKGIYKCYGCGVGGDSVSFIMKHEKLEFIEAIEWLAGHYHIKPDYETKEVNEVEVQESKQMQMVLDTAAKKYQEQLLKMKVTDVVPVEILQNRQLSLDTILEFKIGYAPDEWKFLTTPVINSNMFAAATALGIVVSKSGNNYDQFRNRIMFPIHDHKGHIVAFGGRKLKPVTADEIERDKDNPKYINSTDSKFYKKDGILYGLYQASKSIRSMGYAILTEGYYDVISMHDKGATNTVATCGTAFTSAHARLLKKYTNHVIIFYDMDAAGAKATLKAIDELVKQGMKVQVFASDMEEFVGMDPDNFARMFSGEIIDWTVNISAPDKTLLQTSFPDPFFEQKAYGTGLLQEINNGVIDGIVFKARTLMEETESADEADKAAAFTEVCYLFSLIENEYHRDQLIDKMAKEFKIKASLFNNQVKDLITAEKKRVEKLRAIPDSDIKLPKHVNREDFLQNGFYADENPEHIGLYFLDSGGTVARKTNCVIKPIMHIYSKDKMENRRIVELNNGLPDGRIAIEIENKSFQSLEIFEQTLWNEGHYITYKLDKYHLQKMKNKYSNAFPKCWELKFLGWQPEGFWAYNNMIFHGQNKELMPFNNYGIVQHKGVNYYSPSGSNVHKNVRVKDDEHKNDRMITYIEPPITFAYWAELMHKVYGDAAKAGIVYVFVGLFRDIIFKLNNSCPFLYGYGSAGSGKTTWADSISAVFFKGIKAFNLNQGTDHAFFSRLGRYYNCVITLNEFDEYAVRDNWFRALKGAFDGEGRERGTQKKNKTEVQEIESALLLIGQYLTTKDDASVLSRSVPEEFRTRKFTNEEKALFDELKQYESHGLTALILEPLQHRDTFEQKFADAYAISMRRIKDALKLRELNIKHDRVIQSYTVMLCVFEIMSKHITLPFTDEEYFEYTINRIVRLGNTIGENNALAGFWKTVEFLRNDNQIHEGWDFRIDVLPSIKIKADGEKYFEKQFNQPTKLLLLRLINVQKLYSAWMRKEKGENGLSDANLENYMKADPAFIGVSNSVHFSKKNSRETMKSSAFIFNLEMMNINLERFVEESDEDEQNADLIQLEGHVIKYGKVVDLYGIPVIEFSIISLENYIAPGTTIPVEKKVWTRCNWDKIEYSGAVKEGVKMKLSGTLSVNKKPNKEGKIMEYRNMTVIKGDILAKPENLVDDVNSDDLPF